MIMEDRSEALRRIFKDNGSHDSLLIRDIYRMQDRSLGDSAKLSEIIRKSEEKNSRIALFNEFLGGNILSQVVNIKSFPKYKKPLLAVSSNKIIENRFSIIHKLWFNYMGDVESSQGEEVQVSLDKFVSSLVKGFLFIRDKETKKQFIFAIDFIDGWQTGFIAVYCHERNKDEAANIIRDIVTDSVKNNFFKGAKITPYGKFIKPDSITMDDIILKDEIKKRITSGTVDMFNNIETYKKNNIPIKRGILMEGDPGCQPAGQLVLMVDGEWKRIEEIKVGDRVISPQIDGSTKVSKVESLKEYNSSIYEVNVGKDGLSYRIAEEHLIVAQTDARRRRRIIKAINSEQGNYITINPKNFLRIFNYNSGHIYGIMSPAVEFNKTNFILSPYHLGILLGDGGITNGITVTTVDKEIILELDKLSKIFDIQVTLKKSDKITYTLSTGKIGGKENPLTKQLRDLGLYGLNSHEKFIPEKYLNASIDQRLDLLAGLIDTDGYKNIRGDSSAYEYTTVSRRLAIDVYNLCRSLGFGVTISEKKTNWVYKDIKKIGMAYRLQISTQDLIIPVRIARKSGLLRDSKWKNVRHKPMKIISENKTERVFGFTLDSESGWYITNNWIITHNTGKTLVAKALCNQINSTFIWVTADDVCQADDVSGIYEMARELSPTIVLFEDIDYIGKNRLGDEKRSGSYDKITGELLNQMDGVDSNEGIITLASSNYPKALDKALRNRPGRFDIRVRFELPDEDLRGKMLIKFFGKTNIHAIDLKKIVKMTDGYTGAYIKELVLATIMLALEDHSIGEDGNALIKTDYFDEAFAQLEQSRGLDDIQEEKD